MPPKQSRPKVFHYGRATCTDGYPLQQWLVLARKKATKSKDRVQALDGGSVMRLLSKWRSWQSGAISGLLVEYAPGRLPAGITLDLTKEEIDLTAYASAQPNKEYINGALFFAVHQNHVAYLSHGHLRSHQLSTYLDWLVRTELKLMPPGAQPIFLQQKARKRSDDALVGLKSIELFAPLSRVTKNAPKTLLGKLGVDITKFAMKKLGAEDLPPGLTTADAGQVSRLEVSVRIGLAAGVRKDKTETIDWLARNLDEDLWDNVKVTGRGGLVIDGADLILRGKGTVTYDNGVPVFHPTVDALRSWLLELISTGQVDA
jgi:hypothetical protein